MYIEQLLKQSPDLVYILLDGEEGVGGWGGGKDQIKIKPY